MTTISDQKQLIWADAHVHIYDCFNLEQFLNAGLENFNSMAQKQGYESAETSLLFLTETAKDHYFQQLVNCAQEQSSFGLTFQDWKILPTQENCSVYAKHSNGQGIFIFAGRQIVTEEDLEVLALITADEFQDHVFPIEQVIEQVISRDGIPVIPWGFGKWIGQRGKILSGLLEQNKNSILFLGDNGGRPVFWPKPAYFKQAEQQGLKVLPGTDPLPFSSESGRPGSFGFTIQGFIDPARPAQSVKQILLDPNTKLQSYGKREMPLRFFRNQIAMQLVKRMRKKDK